MAPKKSIAKKKSHAGKKAPRKAGSALYSLFLQKRGGAEAHFWIFDGLDAVVETIWSWGVEQEEDLVSSDWSVQHPRYGWQNAYYQMVTPYHFVGDDAELRSYFAKYFKKCMQGKRESFEAGGAGLLTSRAKIACYRDATRQPFWRGAAGSRPGGEVRDW